MSNARAVLGSATTFKILLRRTGIHRAIAAAVSLHTSVVGALEDSVSLPIVTVSHFKAQVGPLWMEGIQYVENLMTITVKASAEGFAAAAVPCVAQPFMRSSIIPETALEV